MEEQKPSQERVYANISSLRDIALYLEGMKAGKGNLLPLGTIVLDDLWSVIKELNFNGVVETRPKE
jgi:hypothetical protein